MPSDAVTKSELLRAEREIATPAGNVCSCFIMLVQFPCSVQFDIVACLENRALN